MGFIKDNKIGFGELFWGIGAGVGGLATLRRLEKKIRPNSRFVFAEIGIKFLEAAVLLGCMDLGAKYGKAADRGFNKAMSRHKDDEESEKEKEKVKNFAEWKAKVEKEEEEMAETFSQWINPKKEIENGN